ncbi:MAG: hypothetical protein Q8L49_06810 [Burkholderiaceae bacterium]|nr:hypothetical protein [Burkholderiaceae bacterium]
MAKIGELDHSPFKPFFDKRGADGIHWAGFKGGWRIQRACCHTA